MPGGKEPNNRPKTRPSQASGRTDTWNFGPPAYDATVRYEDPNIGRRWFASRERPHLVWAARRDGAPGREIVALTVSQY